MKTKAEKAANRAKRTRKRHAAHEARLLADRLRVGPDPSSKLPDYDLEPPLTVRPFERPIADYRQTPKAWHAVWDSPSGSELLPEPLQWAQPFRVR